MGGVIINGDAANFGMTSKIMKLFTANLCILGILLLVNADEIRLKSGGSVSGIITEEKNGTVTVDIGFGSTVVDTAEIASVARSGDADHAVMRKSWRDGSFDGGQTVSPALKPLMEKLRRLRALRIQAINRQRDLEQLDAGIDSLEHAYTENARNYQALSPDLHDIGQKTINEQYQLVGKAHQLNSSIITIQQVIERKKSDQQNGNPALLEYMDSLGRMDEALNLFKTSNDRKTIKENRPALAGMENDLRQCKAEFKTAIADATFIRGGHIIVPVTINGRGPVMLLLDTGASTVTLSRALASRLGINWRDGTRVSATLADGRTTTGHAILLRSVAIGDFIATGVRATVLEQPPGQGIDGLLGMSYLQRFILRIDPANKKFVLTGMVAR